LKCGTDLGSIDEDRDNKRLGYKVLEVHTNDLCCNCWYEATYRHTNKPRDTLGKTTKNNMSATITTLVV
jgi:hypothetical protein